MSRREPYTEIASRLRPPTAVVIAIVAAAGCGHALVSRTSSVAPVTSAVPAKPSEPTESAAPAMSATPTTELPNKAGDAVLAKQPSDDGVKPKPVARDRQEERLLKITFDVLPSKPRAIADILSSYINCDVLLSRIDAEKANQEALDAEGLAQKARSRAQEAEEDAERIRLAWIDSYKRHYKYAITSIRLHQDDMPAAVEHIEHVTLTSSDGWSEPPEQALPETVTIHPFDVKGTVKALNGLDWKPVFDAWPGGCPAVKPKRAGSK